MYSIKKSTHNYFNYDPEGHDGIWDKGHSIKDRMERFLGVELNLLKRKGKKCEIKKITLFVLGHMCGQPCQTIHPHQFFFENMK